MIARTESVWRPIDLYVVVEAREGQDRVDRNGES